MTRWLDEGQQAAWRRLITVVERLPGILDTQLRRDADLSHFDYLTLAMLAEAPEYTLRMTALAERTSSTLPRLSHVAARLEARGYLERRPCPGDRRATNATLTEAGRQKVAAIAPGHTETVLATVFDGLDDEDVAAIDRVMTKILARLDPGAS